MNSEFWQNYGNASLVIFSILLALIVVVLVIKRRSRDGIDSRQGRRFDVPEGVIMLDGEEYDLVDVSRRGACVRCSRSFAEGEKINFEIDGVAGLAALKWRDDKTGIIGLNFLNVRLDECRRIAKYQVA